MSPRYFSLEEANDLLPQIKPLMGELLERRARVVRDRPRLDGVLESMHADTGSALASTIALDFIAIEDLLEKIKSFGCEVKDINVGLVDFLSERNGREVYLCWRYGEERIEYYHDLHTGFQGRRHV